MSLGARPPSRDQVLRAWWLPRILERLPVAPQHRSRPDFDAGLDLVASHGSAQHDARRHLTVRLSAPDVGRVLLVLFAAAGLLVSGCLGAPAQSTPTASATPDHAGTSTDVHTPTASRTVPVEYIISVGELPESFRTANVTLTTVFVETERDIGPCWPETFSGPYKPTPTPIAPPTGECHRSTAVTLDLTTISDARSLGHFAAPEAFDAGHGLVVTNVSATFNNGSAVTGLRGSGGHVAHVVRGNPDGPYRVELSIDSYRDRPYTYWLGSAVTNATSSAG